MFVIYALHNGDGVPRYIGVTRASLSRRLAGHRGDVAQGGRTRKCRWMRKVERTGTVSIVEIDQATDQLAAWQLERAWIDLCLGMGLSLTNATEGGEGLSGPSDDTRAALRAAWQQMAPEARAARNAKVSAARRGSKATAETKATLSAAQRGKKQSATTVAKRQATIAANNAAGKTRKKPINRWAEMTAEQRANQMRGTTRPRQPLSAEHREKLAATHRGLTTSSDVRQKMSDAHTTRWATATRTERAAVGMRLNGATPDIRSEKARRAALARWSRR